MDKFDYMKGYFLSAQQNTIIKVQDKWKALKIFQLISQRANFPKKEKAPLKPYKMPQVNGKMSKDYNSSQKTKQNQTSNVSS